MFHIGMVKNKWMSVLGRIALVFMLVLGMIGSQPAGAVLADTNYIDPSTAPRIPNLSTSVDQVVGLSNGKIAMITGAFGVEIPVVNVVNTDGSPVYSTDLGSTFGARATNKMAVKLYPIANGELIVTIEGTGFGCDDTGENPFQYLRLDASGNIVTLLTDINTTNSTENCNTDMAELSNGNLAFTYQAGGTSHSVRIMQPNGTAVTGPISLNDVCTNSSQPIARIAANGTGSFMVIHDCIVDTTLYGTLYDDDGSHILVGGVQHFPIGTHTVFSNAHVMGLTDNNFMVAYNPGSGYEFKKVTPTGTVSSAGSYASQNSEVIFDELGDGGFAVFDSRVFSEGGFENNYDTGTIFANDGSQVQATTDLDTTYSDQCDFYWNCAADMSVSPSAGYARGILYVNNLTHDLVMHSFGASTPAPTATTNAASLISSSGATLNGTVNANNADTTVTFEYGSTIPYGMSSSATPGTVSGSSNTAVSLAIGGLDPNTIYYYRVVAVSAGGTTVGSDMTFTTSAVPPTAFTGVATEVGSASATLNGTVNANNASTDITFDYGTNTNYGSTIDAVPSPLNNMLSETVSGDITGLTPNTTYHFRVKAVNIAGTTYGDDETFTTGAVAPTATTDAAGGVSAFGATLNGTVNANNSDTTVSFEFGSSTSYSSTTAATPGTVTGLSDTPVSKTVSGLIPNSTYHYRVVAENSGGKSYGLDQVFTTDKAAPTATTLAASGVGSSVATLNGLVNPNNDMTAVTFEFGPDDGYGSIITAGQSPLNGAVGTAVSADLVGLDPNTTYHYRVVAQNSTGTTYGLDLTFTTEAAAPLAKTDPAGGVSAFSATLNGTVNANNANSAVTFEYGLTDAYGSTVTADQSPVSGLSDTAVSKMLSGLIPGSTYHYRVVAQNSAGTTYGLDKTFTTDAAAPAATTQAASGLSSTGATLNGLVNPNNDTATVTFEYGLDAGYGMSAPAVQSPLDGYNPSSVSLVLSGLLPSTTYHFRVVAQNNTGTTYGLDMTFTTGKYFVFLPLVGSSGTINPVAFLK